MPKLKMFVFRTKMQDFPACAGKVISDKDPRVQLHGFEPLLWPVRTTKRI
jgi:hypothetical protein